MPPQIIGYDPFAKVRGIEQAGENIGTILGEAHKAELALQKQRIAQKGATYLHDVINQRIQETGNPDIGFAPFMDPVVNRAASMVEPVARDYVDLMKGIHEKNVKMLEPKNVPGGYIKYEALKDEQGKPVVDARGLPKYDYHYTQTEPEQIDSQVRIAIEGGKPVLKRDYYSKDKMQTLHTETLGGTTSASGGSNSPTVKLKVADLYGELRKSQKIIQDFEGNEKLKSKFDEIVNSQEFKDALAGNDISLVEGIVSRLLGDQTPQKVQTKLFFDYISALGSETDMKEQLSKLGEDAAGLERKEPGKKKTVKKGGGL